MHQGFLMPSTASNPDFARFRDLLRQHGAAAADGRTCLAADGRYELVYVPFHHVNRAARLAIVGITPGTTQIARSYDSVQQSLRAGLAEEETLVRAKAAAAFGGQMRQNLYRMLDHLRIPTLFGAARAADLWGNNAAILECTSVVPHAAFRAGKMFAGSFDEILGSSMLRFCFEDAFVPSLKMTGPETLFVALGPTPLAALNWCVAKGHLRPEQVLGALAHPSKGSGSQVDVYLGARAADDLHENDPVRRRAPWLQAAAARMRAAVEARLAGLTPPIVSKVPPVEAAPATATTAPVRPELDRPVPTPGALDGIHAFVSRGRRKGAVLRPHVQDGTYIVSHTRYEADYIRVPLHEPLAPYLAKGLKLRMSAPAIAPSLVTPDSIRGWR